MLKKRIIPCLDVRDLKVVKGVNFQSIVEAGNPVELAKKYVVDGADELVFLDITASIEKRETLVHLVELVAQEINIPFTVGGGISSIEIARAVINAGADKISINTSAVLHPQLISEISSLYGSQCVVVAIDTKFSNGEWIVVTHGGRNETNLKAVDWALQAAALGAGEILLTSMNNDGTKSGFAIDITQRVSKAVNIPVIASGGAGEMLHFKTLFEKTNAAAALAASIFHFNVVPIPKLKHYLKENNIPIR